MHIKMVPATMLKSLKVMSENCDYWLLAMMTLWFGLRFLQLDARCSTNPNFFKSWDWVSTAYCRCASTEMLLKATRTDMPHLLNVDPCMLMQCQARNSQIHTMLLSYNQRRRIRALQRGQNHWPHESQNTPHYQWKRALVSILIASSQK